MRFTHPTQAGAFNAPYPSMAQPHAHADAGHGTSHSERARPVYDDINIPILVMVGLVSAIVTFLIIAAVQGLAYRMEDSFQRASNIDVRGAKARSDMIDGQKSLLVGGELGAKVPIDQAMDRVVERYSAGRATTASEPPAGSVSDGHPPEANAAPHGDSGAAAPDDH